ncbi:hypothetical protein K501DRAFT_307663 [Backusella circina FSU 941]|nr:hypothetical protein K501DRAFT_307663 [Backusella circina FSU 941]
MYSSDASRFPTLERIENNIKNNKLDSSTDIAYSKKGTVNSGTQSDVKSISSSIKSKKKKLRKHQTTTDIFANNLSEAVHDAAAYDSADDGYFYNNGLAAPTQTSNLYPPLSPPLPLETPTLNRTGGSSKNESEDYFSDYHHQKYRRPGLKSTVSELPARGVKSLYLNSIDLYKKQRKSRQTRYSTDEDEENAPLLYNRRMNLDKRDNNSRSGFCLGMTFMSVLLLFILCLFFIATPLKHVDIIAVTNVLGTQKQLIFDLHVKARNNNLWPIQVNHASFSVFATSHYVPTIMESDPLEYLATIYRLEDPLIFKAGLFTEGEDTAISQVQIKNPGETNDDISGNERWSLLIRYPYELAIRGVLKHRPFMSKMYSSRICFIIKVDPSTGKITNIPGTEHAVCNDE